MTSPVSPLATVREALNLALICNGMHPAWPKIKEALAVLDSLDGTITLSREEAEAIRRMVLSAKYARASGPYDEYNSLIDILAARIEEAGK